MKKLIFILFVFISVFANAQYYVVQNGQFITTGSGQYVKTSGGDYTPGPSFQDNFDSYSNGSELATQGYWDEERGTIRVYNTGSDGEPYPDVSSTEVAVYYIASIAANQYSQVTVTALAASLAIGPAVRCQGGTGYYYGWYSTPTASYLFRNDNTIWTQLAIGTGWSVNDVVRLAVAGDTLYCYRNGVLDTSVDTDGKYTDASAGKLSSGYVGLAAYGSSTSTRCDSWSAWTFTSPAQPPGTTGQGTLLFYQDFESMALTEAVTSTHVDTIMGIGEPSFSFHMTDNPVKILNETTAGNYMRGWMDATTTGASGGYEMFKTLRGTDSPHYDPESTGWTVPTKYNDKTELWFGWAVRYETGFEEALDGKTGFKSYGSEAMWDYDGSQGWENFVDGYAINTTYDGNYPSTTYHANMVYRKEMHYDYGYKTLWENGWPNGSYIAVDDDWHHIGLRIVLDPNPPDSINGFLEYFYDEVLVNRQDTLFLRTDDSIQIDWACWRWYPSSSTSAPDVDWYSDIDNLSIFEFSSGDSTYTGTERTPIGGTVDFPGWPMDEDTTGWGDFDEPLDPPTPPPSYAQFDIAHDFYVYTPEGQGNGDRIIELSYNRFWEPLGTITYTKIYGSSDFAFSSSDSILYATTDLTPGSYTVRYLIEDSDQIWDTASVYITVTSDADNHYVDLDTLTDPAYIPIVDGDYTYLERGSSFASAQYLYINSIDNWVLGAYGDGARPHLEVKERYLSGRGVFDVYNCSNATVRDIEIYNNNGVSYYFTIYLSGTSDGFVLDNCEVHGNSTYAFSTIRVAGPISGGAIRNNILHDTYDDGVQIYANLAGTSTSNRFIWENNWIHTVNKASGGGDCIQFSNSDYPTVTRDSRYNHFRYNLFDRTNNADKYSLLYENGYTYATADIGTLIEYNRIEGYRGANRVSQNGVALGNARGTIFRYNTIHGTGRGLALWSDNDGGLTNSYIKIYGNLFEDCDTTSIRLHTADTNGDADYTEIYNNTFVNYAEGGGEAIDIDAGNIGTDIRNNIFYYGTSASNSIVGTVGTEDYNIFYPDALSYSYGTHSDTLDPNFITGFDSDYEITTSSNAYKFGTAVGLSTDRWGTSWLNPPSVGYKEYVDFQIAPSVTIYKFIDFSELTPGATSVSEFNTSFETSLTRTAGGVDNDSIKIVTQDTVWSVTYPAGLAADEGVQYTGWPYYNGTDNTDDTLTYVNHTFYMRLTGDWQWESGGACKMIGLGGRDVDDSPGPAGGIYGPTCIDSVPYYEADMGFSTRGQWTEDNPGLGRLDDIGYYFYSHSDSMDWKDCDVSVTYGETLLPGLTWEVGKWYKITQRFILNSVSSPGNANNDGILEWFRNDTCYISRQVEIFRKYEDVKIDYLYYANLTRPDASRTTDQQIEYDDICLWVDDNRSAIGLGNVQVSPDVGSDNRLTNDTVVVVYSNDFDHLTSNSVYPLDSLNADYPYRPPYFPNFQNYNNVYIYSLSGNNALRWFFADGTTSSQSTHGAKWRGFFTQDSVAYEELYYSYDLYVPTGNYVDAADEVTTGKVPSVGGLSAWVYDLTHTFPYYDEGFSAGIRFKSNVSGSTIYLTNYLYTHNLITAVGGTQYYWASVPFMDPDNLSNVYYWPLNTWVNITVRIVMNDVDPQVPEANWNNNDLGDGSTNGLYQVFINGKYSASIDTVRWRNLPGIGVDVMRMYSEWNDVTDGDQKWYTDNHYFWYYGDAVDPPKGNTELYYPGDTLIFPQSWSHADFGFW